MSGRVVQTSYLVECFWPGVSPAELATVAGRAQEAARSLQGRGRELRFLGSILLPSDETVFCFFEGQEADVREVSEQAGVPYERVLEAIRFEGDDRPEEESGRGC